MPVPPVMEAPTAARKAFLVRLVAKVLSGNNIPPPPAFYRRLINPPSALLKRSVIRMLALEAQMYPDRRWQMQALVGGYYSSIDAVWFYIDADDAFKAAETMIKRTEGLFLEHQLAESQKKDKSYGTKRLFLKSLRRFEDAKDVVRTALATFPTRPPSESLDFLGLELANYHEIATRFDAAQSTGTEGFKAFLIQEGYATEGKYHQALSVLDEKIDDYYRFHKKVVAEIEEARCLERAEMWRKIKAERNLVKVRVYVARERALEDKGKELLLQAVTHDDKIMEEYMDITTSGTLNWSEAKQKNREKKLVQLITKYLDSQDAEGEAMEEVKAASD